MIDINYRKRKQAKYQVQIYEIENKCKKYTINLNAAYDFQHKCVKHFSQKISP
jgi:hypothetical protein